MRSITERALEKDFEWDENKRIGNIVKHQLDFIDAPLVFDGTLISLRRASHAETNTYNQEVFGR